VLVWPDRRDTLFRDLIFLRRLRHIYLVPVMAALTFGIALHGIGPAGAEDGPVDRMHAVDLAQIGLNGRGRRPPVS
jgi:hypothetical protein